MHAYSYNKEIKKAVAQMLDAINDITVKRKKGTKTQQVQVSAKLGDASRSYKFLSNPNKTLQVPQICATLTSMRRDSNRSAGINEHLLTMPDINSLTETQLVNYYNTFYGTPVDIEFDVEIFSIYHEDLDQIMCNIVAFCNPAFYVVIPHPKVAYSTYNKTVTIQHQVVWDGNFGFRFPFEVAKDVDYRYYASTKFTFKTWIFPGEGTFANDPSNLITKINFFPEIVGGQGGDGVWTLSNFHAVPRGMEFADYKENVFLGLIKQPYFDLLAVSAVTEVSAGLFVASGYWSALSAAVSGDVYGSSISSVSGDPTYLVTEDKDVLVFSSAEILNSYVANTNLSAMIYQYESTGKIVY